MVRNSHKWNNYNNNYLPGKLSNDEKQILRVSLLEKELDERENDDWDKRERELEKLSATIKKESDKKHSSENVKREGEKRPLSEKEKKQRRFSEKVERESEQRLFKERENNSKATQSIISFKKKKNENIHLRNNPLNCIQKEKEENENLLERRIQAKGNGVKCTIILPSPKTGAKKLLICEEDLNECEENEEFILDLCPNCRACCAEGCCCKKPGQPACCPPVDNCCKNTNYEIVSNECIEDYDDYSPMTNLWLDNSTKCRRKETLSSYSHNDRYNDQTKSQFTNKTSQGSENMMGNYEAYNQDDIPNENISKVRFYSNNITQHANTNYLESEASFLDGLDIMRLDKNKLCGGGVHGKLCEKNLFKLPGYTTRCKRLCPGCLDPVLERTRRFDNVLLLFMYVLYFKYFY